MRRMALVVLVVLVMALVTGASAVESAHGIVCAPICCCGYVPGCGCCGDCLNTAVTPPCEPGYVPGEIPGLTGTWCVPGDA